MSFPIKRKNFTIFVRKFCGVNLITNEYYKNLCANLLYL